MSTFYSRLDTLIPICRPSSPDALVSLYHLMSIIVARSEFIWSGVSISRAWCLVVDNCLGAVGWLLRVISPCNMVVRTTEEVTRLAEHSGLCQDRSTNPHHSSLICDRLLHIGPLLSPWSWLLPPFLISTLPKAIWLPRFPPPHPQSQWGFITLVAVFLYNAISWPGLLLRYFYSHSILLVIAWCCTGPVRVGASLLSHFRHSLLHVLFT